MITIGYGRFEDPETPDYIDFAVPRNIADKVDKYIEALLDEQNFWYWVGENYVCQHFKGTWRNKTTNLIESYEDLQAKYKEQQ